MSNAGFSMGFKPKKSTSKPASKVALSRPALKSFNHSDEEEDTGGSTSIYAAYSNSKTSKQNNDIFPSTPREEEITEFDFDSKYARKPDNFGTLYKNQRKNVHPVEPPKYKAKPKYGPSTLGDMSSMIPTRQLVQEVESNGANIFDYDGVYDAIKGKTDRKAASPDEINSSTGDRQSRYMASLLSASNVRNRDRQIAEEKRIARERKAEGDMYADKEKFVTAAYKKQLEENARLADEESRREAEEAKKAAGKGMIGLYKKILDEDEERHAEAVKAAETLIHEKKGAFLEKTVDNNEAMYMNREKTQEQLAKEINSRGGQILVNDDGEIVDKRELLRSGLNVAPKKKSQFDERNCHEREIQIQDQLGKNTRLGLVSSGSGKQALRERQSRMIEEQLAQQLKRSLDQEVEERERIERAAKTRKTETDVMSARERYFVRKRAAEEAKKHDINHQ